MHRPTLLLLLFLAAAPRPAAAQDTTTTAPPASTLPDTLTDTSAGTLTEAERAVLAALAEPGLHVVHFWAPWCGNSIAEFRSGWYEVIEQNPDVTFTFVTIWNDGQDGRETLRRFAIPERVRLLAQPDHGPSYLHANRRRTFLGRDLTWTPTTWIFRDGGTLAYALHYGEVDAALLQQLLDHTRRDWMHE